jgi:Na+-driven multidrug efflux pump
MNIDLRSAARKIFKRPEELELTEGPIGRSLFFLSLPIVITNLLQVAYNFADTFWLGRYSTDALAAISLGFPLVYLFISLGLGLTVAGSPHRPSHLRLQLEYCLAPPV